MKSKLNPIYIIVGLFLFKVALLDNVRNIGFGHSGPDSYRRVANTTPVTSNLKPIR
ncbi:MAG: hypothetical protein WC635_09290 [Bacteriovorax sp.]|jgi:hypothetical protein